MLVAAAEDDPRLECLPHQFYSSLFLGTFLAGTELLLTAVNETALYI
jgi:hypothetical protein